MRLSEAHHSLTVIDHVGTELLSSEVARDIGGRIMTAIERLGERPHNFVVFQASNSAYLLAGVFGALLGGFAPVVISEKLSLLETHDILSDLPHSIVLSDSKLTEFAHSAKSELVEQSDRFLCRPMHFTSGTSGRPKGVWSGWLTSGQSEDLARDEREAWGLTESDVHLVSGPLSHSAPLRFALHTLLNGGMVAVQKRFDAHTASDLIEDGRVTTAFMAPVHLQRILDSAPPRSSSLRLVAHAGSPCPDRVRLAAIDHFGLDELFEFYGSTEGQFTLCGAREWREHLGTVGRARPGRDLRTDEDGRIWCKAPPYARFTYWGDSEKTRTAWQEDWFTVGDLGRLDSLGYLYLDGRRTDLVISGGVNIYPAEIERALSEMPGIESIAAFGVEDSQWGQRVCVAYVGSATEQEILDHCLRVLAPYKHPRSITRVVELPRTHTGKIDRTALPTLIDGLDPVQ